MVEVMLVKEFLKEKRNKDKIRDKWESSGLLDGIIGLSKNTKMSELVETKKY